MESWRRHARSLAPLLEAVQERRSAAGLVTFSDQLRSAAAASLPIRRVFAREVVRGIDHLLVDEFQDTDDVQCRLVEMLALTGEPSRRPSLFIVGDPKQSIYAWRSADLAAYDDFVARVVEAGGDDRRPGAEFPVGDADPRRGRARWWRR